MDGSENSSENYRISKIRMYYELKLYIEDVKSMKLVENEENNSGMFSFMSSLLNTVGNNNIASKYVQSEAVNNYWDDNSQNMIYAGRLPEILILQKTLRVWIYLSRLRIRKRVLNQTAELVILRQAAVRQWLAISKFSNLERLRESNDEKFNAFINDINNGLSVEMFSKTFGTLRLRIIKFDSSYSSIVYKTSDWMPHTAVKINDICEVKKGLSGYKYSQVISAHKAWCFHLVVLGGKLIDIQAEDGHRARELFLGFKRLVQLFFTQSPFFIDKDGFPRRAGPSVIKCALMAYNNHAVEDVDKQNDHQNDKNVRYSSEADRSRYRNAIRMLKSEYDEWEKAEALEKVNSESEQTFNTPDSGVSYKPKGFGSLLPAASSRLIKNQLPPPPHVIHPLLPPSASSIQRANTMRKSSIEFANPHRSISTKDIALSSNSEIDREVSDGDSSPSPSSRRVQLHPLLNEEDEVEFTPTPASGDGEPVQQKRVSNKWLTMSHILGLESLNKQGTLYLTGEVIVVPIYPYNVL